MPRVAAVLLLFVISPAGRAGDTWRIAERGYRFEFPRDHGSHPEYKLEWWYYTGNLQGEDGSRYGYQLTFFRVGVDFKPENPSAWAVRDLFMAHLAVTDVPRKSFRFVERLSRAGPGWAGAETGAYRVWNGPWSVTLDSEGRHLLRAEDGDIAVDLVLEPGKRPVLHGESGYSPKGSQPGNASHYYSLTRMPSRGTIRSAGRKFRVQGTSWMDHEFGTSFLEQGQFGWDWFSMQLDDGTDVMVFQLRRAGGTRDPYSSGTIVGPRGETTPLNWEQFELLPGRTWKSYPVEWRIRIPGQAIDLQVRAVLDEQELRTEHSGVTYWEGAVEIEGTRRGAPVRGRGYLEMTGTDDDKRLIPDKFGSK